jgi:hypothetical protein
MAGEIPRYGYFLNIEDDIEVPAVTIANVIEFDRTASLAEVFHPNRLEIENGIPFCVDFRAVPDWTTSRRMFKGRRLAVANNPHSALMFLSQEKFRHACRHADLARRGTFYGGPMASAFCNVNAPFALWRSYDDLAFHHVVHLDPWMGPLPPG